MKSKLNIVVNKIKSMSAAKLAAIVVSIVALIFLYNLISDLMISAERKPVYERSGLKPIIETIPNGTGEVLVAQNNGRSMYIDTETLNIRIVDDATGRTFNTLIVESQAPDAAKSPLVIRYLGRDNSLYEWDAYRSAIANERFAIHKIDNGVMFRLDFGESESLRLNEYMPTIISIDRYHEAFLDEIDRMVESGEMTEDSAKNFLTVLNVIYQRDDERGCYYNKITGSPPASAVRILVELARTVNYTTEMLIEDSAEFDVTVTIVEPAGFQIYVENTLENGDFVVNIPVYEHVNEHDFYTLQNISVYPAFDGVTTEENDGFIFVPDGSGMLIALDSNNAKYPEYYRDVYGNDYFDTLYFKSDFEEEIHMPVFGMYNKGSNARTSSGFMCIIERGAELAHIGVKLKDGSNASDGAYYNGVYSALDAMQYSRVRVFGPYSSDDARYTATTGPIDFDFTLRYKLFTEDANYWTFAEAYRNYLIEENDITVEYDNSAKMFIELLGAITIRDQFLGVPHDKTISMTDYKEALEIVNDLDGRNVVINYKWLLNGGKANTLSNKANLVGVNGKRSDLEKLLSQSAKNREVFVEVELISISDYRGFNDKRFAVNDYYGESIYVPYTFFPDGTFYGGYYYGGRFYLNPLYLTHVTDKFINASKDFDNISITELGNLFYANYDPRNIVDPIVTNNIIVRNNLEKLYAEKTLALENPNIDKIRYAAYSSNVSRESSNYGVSYCSIPFRQLVMNGITQYTTLDANMSTRRADYFLLQALELGSIPKFTLSYKNVDKLLVSQVTQFYSVEYSLLSEDVKSLYDTYETIFNNEIKSKEIVGHEMLAHNVFMTTYANGATVVVNYNNFEVETDYGVMDGLGYLIVRKGE